jgi:hypothetical protein
MSVSISEIIAGASLHEVPLAGECAGYLVLAAADQAVSAPRRIGPDEVKLHDDGTVRVEGARAAEEADSEADLRALLDALLLRASSATPGLLRASRRSPGRGIAALVREIETALIPVNRAAAHRALARLERETERARRTGKLDVPKPPAIARREPEPVQAPPAPPVASPAPPVASPVPPPVVVLTASEPPSAPEASLEEIPSLFAPAVEPVLALPAEMETRPEPIVVRRSAPPPAPTPSPPPLPGARTPSPPPFPVLWQSPEPPPVVFQTPSPPPAVVLPTTPVLGTRVQSHSDDEVDIEVVLDDELMEDELTAVLGRSAPLEVSAMFQSAEPPAAEAQPEQVAQPEQSDQTDPSPPVLDDEPSEIPSSAVAVEPYSETQALPLVVEPNSETLALAFEPHGETQALALAIEPIVPEQPPVPHRPMPVPRKSDIQDLLEKMTEASADSGDELRKSLKGLAGLEPTPPPPET